MDEVTQSPREDPVHWHSFDFARMCGTKPNLSGSDPDKSSVSDFRDFRHDAYQTSTQVRKRSVMRQTKLLRRYVTESVRLLAQVRCRLAKGIRSNSIVPRA